MALSMTCPLPTCACPIAIQPSRGLVTLRRHLPREAGDPGELAARMEDQLARRDAAVPPIARNASAGSTFRNPAVFLDQAC